MCSNISYFHIFAREEFGVLARDVSLKYVIESEPAAYRVRCADGCGGVGKCGNPTVEQLEVPVKLKIVFAAI